MIVYSLKYWQMNLKDETAILSDINLILLRNINDRDKT